MSILRLLFLFLFLIPGCCVAQRFRSIVPYTEQNGKLLIDATVNGQRGRFLLDTGAPCCVSYSFAHRLGLKGGSEQTGQDSNGRPVTTTIVTLDSLRIGAVLFRNVQAMQWNKGNPVEQFGIDGILGYNLMQKGIVKFSARPRTFVFTTISDSLGLDFSHAVSLLPDPYVPLVEVKLPKAVADTVMFDLGAHALYEMSERSYLRLASERAGISTLAEGKGSLSIGAAGVEQITSKHRVKIPHLDLAGFDFRNVATVTTGARDSRIGSELLKYGDVVIDFPRRTFYFLPHEGKNSAEVYVPEWEVVPIATLGGTMVAGIVWNSRLPIRQGDRIVAVNGRRFDNIDLVEATTRGILSMPGNKAEITFVDARTGKETTITIHRK